MLTFPAAILGRLPGMSGGLLMIVPDVGFTKDACVAIEDVELERVGEDGRMAGPAGAGGGEGAFEIEEFR